MEANRRAEYQAIGSQTVRLIAGDATLNANLETFFPFDPYRLKQSQAWIDGIYRDWASVAIEDDEDEEDEEGDVDEEGMTTRAKSEDTSHGLGESFEQMSISPSSHMIGIATQL